MINEEERELVEWAKNQGLGIGNGATKGDEEGEWTQIGQRGCTTIDYVIRNEEGRHKMQEMVIGNRIKSDHFPLEVRIEWKRGAREDIEELREASKKSVRRWDMEGTKEYQNKLQGGVRAWNWKELKEKVTEAMPRMEIRGKREEHYEEKWWD